MAEQGRRFPAAPGVCEQRGERCDEGGQHARGAVPAETQLREWRSVIVTMVSMDVQYLAQVRITTQAAYAVGSLWITDIVHIPFGCSVSGGYDSVTVAELE